MTDLSADLALADAEARESRERVRFETEAWLIRMSDGTRFIHGHNAIGDYRAIDPGATVVELVPRAALAPAVPPGWKMVPVEPTPEMCKAAVRFANGDAVYKNVTGEVLKIEEDIYGEVYAAMLSAAPSAPVTPDAQPEPEMTDCPHGVPHRWSCGECDAPSAKEPTCPKN